MQRRPILAGACKSTQLQRTRLYIQYTSIFQYICTCRPARPLPHADMANRGFHPTEVANRVFPPPNCRGFSSCKYTSFPPCDGVVCVGHRDPYQTLIKEYNRLYMHLIRLVRTGHILSHAPSIKVQ